MPSSSHDSTDLPTTGSGSSGVGIAAALAITVVACCLHVVAVRAGMPADSAWFAIVGAGFLAVTAAAHLAVLRGNADDSLGAVGALLVSMAIRLSGTFVILGLMLWLSPLDRNETVFNVLFWYITLTATDLISLVRDRRRTDKASATRRSLAIGGGDWT